jgi:hypothetical protein
MMPAGGVLTWVWVAGLRGGGFAVPVKLGILSILLFVMGFVMLPLGILKVLRRRDLILGADAVKIVGENEKVELQVPYTNIAGIALLKGEHGGLFIGAKLHNPRDRDVVIPSTVRNYGDWDCRLLENSWPVPLELIYEWLNEKLGTSQPHDPTAHVRWER